MSLHTFPNTYEAIVEFQNISQPQFKWRNTVSFFSPTVPTPTDGIIVALVAFFTDMVHTDVNFVQLVCYNWARGGPQPYPTGLPLFTLPVGVAGTADAAWGYSGAEVGTGGEVVLRLDKTISGGLKPGKLFLRGLIREGDTGAASGGTWTLASGTPLTAAKLELIVQNSGLLDYLGTHSLHPQYLFDVAYSKKHDTAGPGHIVFDIDFHGVTTNKLSRKNRR